MSGPPTRHTRQLLLRAPQPSDVGPLFAIQGDATAMRFTYCAPDRDGTAAWVTSHAERFAEDGFAPWTAVLAAADRVVGWGGLCRDPKAPDWGVEVAYFIAQDCWGRGLAGEIVAAALELAFAELGLAEVGAYARRENRASLRVLEKAGFERVRSVPELGRDAFRILPARWLETAHPG